MLSSAGLSVVKKCPVAPVSAIVGVGGPTSYLTSVTGSFFILELVRTLGIVVGVGSRRFQGASEVT